MISTDKKFIFISYPRTGSSSIIWSLRDYLDYDMEIEDGNLVIKQEGDGRENRIRHLTLRELVHHKFITIDDIKNSFIFTVIRTPWDRLVSQYFYERPNFRTVYPEHFINNLLYYDENEYGEGFAYENLSHYLRDLDNSIRVDYVIRFERLQEDFNEVCEILDIPERKLPTTNVTKHIHYSKYYTKEMKELVRCLYLEDIWRFNLEFRRLK